MPSSVTAYSSSDPYCSETTLLPHSCPQLVDINMVPPDHERLLQHMLADVMWQSQDAQSGAAVEEVALQEIVSGQTAHWYTSVTALPASKLT